MGITKTDAIKIRVSKEQKDLIKRVAQLEDTTMSDFVLTHIEHLAANKELDIKNKEIIEERIQKTEENIQKIKENLKNRKESHENKQNWFKRIFARKS
ncbi:DUF1778 domain-containing protein [Clostridium perfringens]|uniref:type II toxin-antitoxin system TacA family antitoxin n=1 Tax=Clostridium perfringens TaxID=1502 RepID=UPI0018E4AAC2|nr:DUF1778 domain-containing protein [Clostridium perfringens]MBI6048946.1 DUF1778 domain-containing protein [Clostridium perfringens]